MRNADVRRAIPCLRLKADDMPWLVVEDTAFGRSEGLMFITGEDGAMDENLPTRLIVKRCEHTRAELDALPEWSP